MFALKTAVQAPLRLVLSCRPAKGRALIELLLLALPVLLSLALALGLSEREIQQRAALLADLALDRSAHITTQISDAFRAMHVYAPAKACSASSVDFMRSVDLSSSLLQGVGFLSRDALQCSSLGSVPTYVGPPDYISATNTSFRRDRTLAEARRTKLLLVSDSDGYTALIHPSLLFSLERTDSSAPQGLVALSNRQTIIARGDLTIDWRSTAMDGMAGIIIQDGWVVAWQRSPKWDHFAYAAVASGTLYDTFATMCLIFLPLGAAGSLLFVVANRRLTAARESLPSQLRNGLRHGELVVVYQPIVELATGRWVGAEVLARWRRSNGEWVSPDVFVPIAEQHGIIRELTRTVLALSIEDFGSHFIGLEEFYLSINISSSDLAAPDFADEVAQAVVSRGLSPKCFHLEVTERAEVKLEAEVAGINSLREQGFAIGIDDFGIGYSNLAYIDRLAIDYIKIDRVFVANSTRDTLGRGVLEHIIDIAQDHRLTAIAEGIETGQQLADLIARGVAYGQGYLFARPLPIVQFVSLLREQAGRDGTVVKGRAA
ncbi:EAL domain-containing protein [Devosia sp. CN2-171]|uniref:EAL domain-containing protein n=1 Tax=Devosia sp. CN2-171 TaxID=3400909 RepID=UPI003BF82FA0